MNIAIIRMTFAFALVLILTATGLWAAGADEGSTAAAADKKYVTDPSTGKVVVAPQYGGTLTYASGSENWQNADVYYNHTAGSLISGVVERLTIADWAFERDVFSYRTTYFPDSVFRGHLAESWETPDATTIVFQIRKGVHWHDKAPMNGRELTAKDIEYNLHRYLGLGSGYTEPAAYYATNPMVKLPWESITATDEWTLVFKLTKADPDGLRNILTTIMTFTYPPEVIEEHGDVKDWRNLVGTGPFELTDWTEGTSVTWTKNPNYWGFDAKYPENRLPYVDTLKALIIPDAATRLAALRSAKIDLLAYFGGVYLSSMDQVDSLRKTNPEILMEPFSFRSLTSWPVNSSRPPFDDPRVAHAMQMALDLDSINAAYWRGYADTTPQGYLGVGMQGYVTPFADWPEEVKGYYTYDPEGAEALLDEAGYPRGADGIRLKIVLNVGLPHWDVAYNDLAASYGCRWTTKQSRPASGLTRI